MSYTHTSHLADTVADETIRLLGVKSHPNTHTHTHTYSSHITPYHHWRHHTHTHSNQVPMSPYRERNGQKRVGGLGEGKTEGKTDSLVSVALK